MKTVGVIRPRLWHFLVLLVLALAWGGMGRAWAQVDDVSPRFPTPEQVAADYPDEVERYVALNVLWDFLHAKAADLPAAKEKRGTYYNASSAIRSKYLVMGEAPATQFDDRVRQLTANRDFGRSVLEKYQVLDVAAESAPVRQNEDVTDAMIEDIFWKALPVLIGTFVVMLLVTKLMLRISTASRTWAWPAAATVAGVPALPEALGVIKVPGLRYTVGFLTGLVVHKESAIHTTHESTTTPAQAYTVGNTIYFSAPVTTTRSTSATVDTVWLKTPEGRDASWTLPGDYFQSRPGQVISAIARRIADNRIEFVLAYNHATGELRHLSAAAHVPKMGKAWVLATLVGSIGFGYWIGLILSIQPVDDPMDRMMMPWAEWIMGLIAAAFIAVFMVLLGRKKIIRQRENRFAQQYLPGYQQFLAQATPYLHRFFGRG